MEKHNKWYVNAYWVQSILGLGKLIILGSLFSLGVFFKSPMDGWGSQDYFMSPNTRSMSLCPLHERGNVASFVQDLNWSFLVQEMEFKP
jgi:hypothetical protein